MPDYTQPTRSEFQRKHLTSEVYCIPQLEILVNFRANTFSKTLTQFVLILTRSEITSDGRVAELFGQPSSWRVHFMGVSGTSSSAIIADALDLVLSRLTLCFLVLSES